MASSEAGRRKRPIGRPKRNEKLSKIYLRESTFKLWRQFKESQGFGKTTDSVFAEVLLHRAPLIEEERNEAEEAAAVHTNAAPSMHFNDPPMLASTPTAKRQKANNQSFVDVTGLSACASTSSYSDHDQFDTDSPVASPLGDDSLLSGDPFEASRAANMDSSDSESDNELEQSLAKILNEMDDDSHDDSSASEREDGPDQIHLSFSFDGIPDDSIIVDEVQEIEEVQGDDGEMTVTMVEPDADKTAYHDETIDSSVPAGLYRVQRGGDSTTLGSSLCTGLQKMLDSGTAGLKEELDLCATERAVVSVHTLKNLLPSQCHCGEERTIKHYYCGVVILIEWNCPGGHYGLWESSSVLCTVGGRKIYVDNIQFCLALMFSGNNFTKIELLCKFLSLRCLSSTYYYRVHRQYSSKVVEDMWTSVRTMILDILKKEEAVGVSGDGRNDSPGFCARYCCYILMEETTNIIIEAEVVDKRETGGNSPTMEKLGLSRILQRLMTIITMGDLTTDASSSIIGLVRSLKEQYPAELGKLFHDLDIWHKACKLTKALTEASKAKGCKDLGEWVEPVRNHFWFCAQECKGDETCLKDMWLGVLHHVCGEHFWSDGECKHGPLTSTETDKTFLSKDSPAMLALRKIVLDVKWLNSLKYYTRFKHTSALENFNSMLLKYAPKRNSFDYVNFIERVNLGILDHNFHVFRGQGTTKDGKLKYSKHYNKRSKKWHAQPVKVEKTFPHIPFMMATVLQLRKQDDLSMARKVPLPAHHPRRIAPTIALRESPALEGLVSQRITRYSSEPSTSKDTSPP